MKFSRLLMTCTAVAFMSVVAPQSFAATPADTLVEAFAIDDIISLDPQEAFELSTAEVTGNTYSLLVRLDVDDPSKLQLDLADSWSVSDDGLTYTFKLKPDLKFASGNPITADDFVFSIERLIKLDKSPAFLFNQFGLNGDNVTDLVKAVDPLTVAFTVDKPYASSFVLNVMSSAPASVVDKKLVMEHAVAVAPSDTYKWETDFGNEWLKTNSAGSGPFNVITWKANEAVVLERNDNYYGDAPVLARVIYRHMKESAGQRLALENGDVDIARNLSPSDLDAIANNANLAVTARPKGTVYYISLNQKNENLSKPEVIEAMKYLVDYDAIGATLIKGIGTIHQSFLPIGQLGAIEDNPYTLDVAKAKELLAAAGLPDGFSVTMDVRNTQPVTGIAENFQQTAAEAGIKVEIIPGDGKQTLTKYRARQHDIYIGQWGSDYWDPNSNAETFVSNPDNSDDASSKTLAWRNAWDPGAMTEATKAALLEMDADKRAAMYVELQKQSQQISPFVMIYQQTENGAYSTRVKGFKLGPSFDTNLLAPISKD